MSIFDTFTSALGTTEVTAGRFAAVALEFLQEPSHGGLAGLLDGFRDHGLDDAVRSWLGTGRNLPIGRHDIERVLGAASLERIAGRAGVPVNVAANELASVLPQLVDLLTPGGALPEGRVLEQAFDQLRSKIGMI
jgi:uncharacterized protein YidB (DUF937 family)